MSQARPGHGPVILKSLLHLRLNSPPHSTCSVSCTQAAVEVVEGIYQHEMVEGCMDLATDHIYNLFANRGYVIGEPCGVADTFYVSGRVRGRIEVCTAWFKHKRVKREAQA